MVSHRLAIGDPQAPFETFLGVLERHRLLGPDRRLRPEVQLVSLGDHFDWGTPAELEQAAADGVAIVEWLASHPPEQVVLLAGNHDLARVGELAGFDDARFAAARVEAGSAWRAGDVDRERERAFLERYPELPSAESAARDFSCFRVAQRDLVVRLLQQRRLRLAFVAAPDLLLTHAGVTRDDIDGLRIPAAADAATVAGALNRALDAAVASWQRGPLAIPGIHAPGNARDGEARGLLCHRPARPSPGEAALFQGPLRRRFDPRRLPLGLTQAIGHIRDTKCRRLLGDWVRREPARDGPLRHLVTDGEQVRYALGVPEAPARGAATLLFADGALNGHRHDVSGYELLDLDTRRPVVVAA